MSVESVDFEKYTQLLSLGRMWATSHSYSVMSKSHLSLNDCMYHWLYVSWKDTNNDDCCCCCCCCYLLLLLLLLLFVVVICCCCCCCYLLLLLLLFLFLFLFLLQKQHRIYPQGPHFTHPVVRCRLLIKWWFDGPQCAPLHPGPCLPKFFFFFFPSIESPCLREVKIML